MCVNVFSSPRCVDSFFYFVEFIWHVFLSLLIIHPSLPKVTCSMPSCLAKWPIVNITAVIFMLYIKRTNFFFFFELTLNLILLVKLEILCCFFFQLIELKNIYIYYIKSNQNLWVLYKVKVIFRIHKTIPAFYLLYFCLCAYSTSQSLFIVFMLDLNLKCLVLF